MANIGKAISGDHLDTVKDCFQEKDNPGEVRVAALKVFWYESWLAYKFFERFIILRNFRSVPCHIRGDAAMKILADESEDSEIRIAAYLGVMKCADYQTILNMKDLLANEQVNQGSVHKIVFQSK